GPEALVAAQPVQWAYHRVRPQPHRDGTPLFPARDKTCVLKNVQMLHYPRQGYREGLRKFADGHAVFAFEPVEYCPARLIDQSSKGATEVRIVKLHHAANSLVRDSPEVNLENPGGSR